MLKKFIKKNIVLSLATLALLYTDFHAANACTRALYVGEDQLVLTGRSMDWSEDMFSNLWVFPKGMQRNGAAGVRSVTWTSKYGSIIVSGYEIGSTDGMNEEGLVANLLYLAESDYGKLDPNLPVLSILAWAQYVLDNFATVSETVDMFSKETFQIVAPILPEGSPAQLHLAISDASGDSAIFEYVKGKLVVHHGKQYTVMTNSPLYDQQLALNAYWANIGGLVFLPGTNRAADRFARTSFSIGVIPKKTDPHYINAVPDKKFEYQAVASVLGVIRSVSVPLGITTPKEPNIASTLWRTLSDQKNKIYYFDSATMPNTFWVDLADLDFKIGAPVKKLTIAGGKVFSGNVASLFVDEKPFAFLPLKI